MPKKKRAAVSYSLRILCEHRDLDEVASTNDDEASTSNAQSRSQSWRDKLKLDNPKKYDEVALAGKKDSTYYRIMCATAQATLRKRNLTESERQKAEMWLERQKRSNETARLRMKKMNDKKKREKDANPNQVKKVETRQQTDKRKGKETAKKAKQRAGFTEKKKQEINTRRREVYKQKKEEASLRILEEERRKSKEREDKLIADEEAVRIKIAELDKETQELFERNSSLPEGDQIDMRSKGARVQALKRVKHSLPRRRSHEISTRADLHNNASPAKQAQMIEAGLPGPSTNPMNEAILKSISDGMTPTEQSKKKSSKRKLLAGLMRENLRTSKSVRAAAKKFGCSRKLLLNARRKVAGRKAITLETIHLIQDYYEKNSNPLPDKKLVSKKTLKPRHILKCTISKLYEQYQQDHPGHKVSSGVFFTHRPTHVKTKSQAKYIGCLCEYCENVALKLKVINQLQPGTFTDDYKVTSATMCPKPVDATFNNPACIKRQCKQCGTNMLDDRMKALLSTPTQVTWTRWEIVSAPYYGKQGKKDVKKRKPIQKQGTLEDLLTELKEEVYPHAEHLFNKDWQNAQEAVLIDKLRANEVLGVYDFAENFKCGHQREVQSAYYSQDSATIHPVVTYYNCNDCSKPVRESIILISDDLTHDYHLVNAFQKVVSNHLMTTRDLKLTTFYRFSDGCSSQYKSKGPISDISYGKQDFGYTIHHNFSGTRHGKGASDGESGVVKRMATDAVKAGTAVISTSQQLYAFLAENATKGGRDNDCCIPFRRSVFFVKHDDVQRERQDRAVKTVAGTRALHSVKSVTGGKVAIRNLSCFCDACRGCGIICHNALYVNPWKVVKLTNGKALVDDRAPAEEVVPAQDPGPSTHDDETVPGPPADDGAVPAQDPGRSTDDNEAAPAQDPGPSTHDEAAKDPGPSTHDEAAKDPGPSTHDDETVPGPPADDEAVPAQDPGRSTDDNEAAPAQDTVPSTDDEAAKDPGPSTHDEAAPAKDPGPSTVDDKVAPAQDNDKFAPAPNQCLHSAVDHENIKVNSYVGVQFQASLPRRSSKTTKASLYMAMVSHKHDEQDLVQVRFMRRRQKGLYEFSSEPEATHPTSDIVKVLTDPVVAYDGRALCYQFIKNELDSMSSNFMLK